jgi:hypothetical protein
MKRARIATAPPAPAPAAPKRTGRRRPKAATESPERAAQGVSLPLPHESDESLGGVAPEPDTKIQQARKDIASGQVDTDLRSSPGLDAENRARILRRGRR